MKRWRGASWIFYSPNAIFQIPKSFPDPARLESFPPFRVVNKYQNTGTDITRFSFYTKVVYNKIVLERPKP